MKKVFAILAMIAATVLAVSCNKDGKEENDGDYTNLEFLNIETTSENHYVIQVGNPEWSAHLHVVAPETQAYSGVEVPWAAEGGYPLQPKAGEYPYGMDNSSAASTALFYGGFMSEAGEYTPKSGKLVISYKSSGEISIIVDALTVKMGGSEEKELKFKYEGEFFIKAPYKAVINSVARLEDSGTAHQYSIQVVLSSYALQFLVTAKSGQYYLPSAGQPDVPFGSFYTSGNNLSVQRAMYGSDQIEIDSAYLNTYIDSKDGSFKIDGSFVPKGGEGIQFKGVKTY